MSIAIELKELILAGMTGEISEQATAFAERNAIEVAQEEPLDVAIDMQRLVIDFDSGLITEEELADRLPELIGRAVNSRIDNRGQLGEATESLSS